MRGRRTLFLLLVLAAALAARASADDWKRDPQREPTERDSCIGGSRCGGDYPLNLPLERAAVDAVRFFAHDNVGRWYRGRLEVAIDGHILVAALDITRSGRYFEIDAHGRRGRDLTFRAVGDDEVVVSHIQVLYRHTRRHERYDRRPFDRDRDHRDRYRGDGWRRLPLRGCIGGSHCERNGYALEARLSGAPVHAVRLLAHDNVGRHFTGRLRVLLDGYVIEPYVDLDRHPEWREIPVDGLRARHLVLEVLSDDEVVIEAVEVRYGGRRW